MALKEKKLTVRQAIETLGLGRTTIYSWIKEGKLRAETTPRGKLILLTEEEEQKIKELTQLYSSENISELYDDFENDSEEFNSVHEGTVVYTDPIQNSSPNFSSVHPQESKVMLEMLRTLNILNEKLLNYSEQAGQVKLLTDSENKTKEEYFKTIQENATLKVRLDRMEQENNELKKQMEKKKSFFGFKI